MNNVYRLRAFDLEKLLPCRGTKDKLLMFAEVPGLDPFIFFLISKFKFLV